jgi:hypothetical protein
MSQLRDVSHTLLRNIIDSHILQCMVDKTEIKVVVPPISSTQGVNTGFTIYKGLSWDLVGNKKPY